MKIRYLKSSTVTIETSTVKILCDPWLTDGEYYGAWYHYPPFEFKTEFFEDVDYIYVSHIHPDHFSRATFELLSRKIPILIHTYDSKFLKLNIERLGFEVKELPNNQRTHLKDGVHINIIAADNCNPELCASFFGCGLVETRYGSTQIDSMCVIDNGDYVLVNTNDCPYDLSINSLQQIRNHYKQVDFLMVGYGGAGPYPQCFKMPDQEQQLAAQKKEIQFLEQGIKFIKALQPRYILPFAGTYVLGGKLAPLNYKRGVPEIERAKEYFDSKIATGQKVILLNTYEYFDLSTDQESIVYKPTDFKAKQQYIEQVLATNLLDYESEDMPSLEQLKPLLDKAYQRFEDRRKLINFVSDTTILIKLSNQSWCTISVKGEGIRVISNDEREQIIDNYVAYELDSRLFLKILEGPRYAHWNNAEIGSHVTFDRKPDHYERALHHCMCFFHA